VDRRTTIGKALGIIMGVYNLDDDTAMDVLRRLSQQGERKLYDIAADVVHDHRLPAPDQPDVTTAGMPGPPKPPRPSAPPSGPAPAGPAEPAPPPPTGGDVT